MVFLSLTGKPMRATPILPVGFGTSYIVLIDRIDLTLFPPKSVLLCEIEGLWVRASTCTLGFVLERGTLLGHTDSMQEDLSQHN